MGLSIVSEDVATLPVTLAEAKQHLYIGADTDADRDATLTVKLALAAREFEKITGRCLITKTLKYSFDKFPCTDRFFLERSTPLQSVSSIKYYDTDGTLTTVSTDVYGVKNSDNRPAQIYLKYGQVWPTDLHDSMPDAVEVEFIAGYGDAATDIPDDVKAVISLIAGDLYKYREDTLDGPGIVVAQVLSSSRRFLKYYKVYHSKHVSQSR